MNEAALDYQNLLKTYLPKEQLQVLHKDSFAQILNFLMSFVEEGNTARTTNKKIAWL